jgi:hypothetical protein
MSGPLQRFAGSTLPFWLLAASALALFAAIGSLRLPSAELRGDEGTYLAMAASLARDGDLAFTAPDAAWAAARPDGVALILERTARGVTYSKPVLYPLLAAPFVAVAGASGMMVLNALALAAGFALARALLARVGARSRATETVLTVACAACVVPYVAWRMAESLEVGLAAGGLALALAVERPAAGAARGWTERLLAARRAPLAGALLLGLLVGLREPQALVALVPAVAALTRRDVRHAAKSVAAVTAGYLVVLGLTWALTGAVNPYKAPRTTFNAETGWPVGAGADNALARFASDDDLATSSLSARPDLQPALTAYSTLYFFVGRHSGLLAYLPALLVLAAVALGARERVALAALGGAAALAVFYLVWWPSNYFGGETFLGNRYLLAAYPALLVALPRLPSRRALAATWCVAAVFGVSAFVSVRRTAALDPTSQSHAHAGLFRALPYESTASGIDGRRDRYWSDDFLRFVDPYARVGRDSFEIDAGAPAAEIELASRRPDATSRWLVSARAPRATLVVSDWRRTRRYELTGRGETSGGPVEIELAPAWRVHPFWWSQGRAARARLVRFALETPDRRPATARVRYLGRRPLPASYARAVVAAPLPPEIRLPAPGASLHLRLSNTSGWTWSADDPLPVQIGVRWLAFAGEGSSGEQRVPLPRPLGNGGTEELDVPLEPPGAGRYRVVVDLVAEDLAWFADKTGAPLAEGEVSVLPAPK